MKKIKITIDPLGKPKVEVEGFVGGECLEATKKITDKFDDGANMKVEYTSDMYMCSQSDSEMDMEMN